jgi:outer membrane protein W
MHHYRTGILAFAALVAGAHAAHAQAANYQPIRVDSGLVGTYASASGRGGFGAIVEPKFAIHDQVSVGLRFEGAVMFGGSFGNDSTKVSLGAVASALAKGEYLLTTGTVRPFVGLGLGVFDIVSQSVEAGPMTSSVDQRAGRYFGVAPQIGIDLGRLRLAATYNAILGADVEVHQTVGNIDQTASYSQNYLTFEMSFRFGGGRIVRPAPIFVAPPMPAPAPPPPPPAAAPPPAA